MTKTKHPAAGCTPVQRAAFERVAIGDDSCLWGKTAERLIERGLIVRSEEASREGTMRFVTYRYHVTLSVHAQWCQWCAENVSDPA